ncbi:MAG: LuxR family transcriptional regulator [Xanthobacteraceae bacterium]|nr:LuxR family transcriptional regulator [Xanthobacteraceae bacterium]
MTRTVLDQTLAIIRTIERAQSPAAVSSSLLSVATRFGFTKVLAGIIPRPGMTPEQQVANVVLHDWPDQWSHRYFAQGYLFQDPTIKRVCSSTEPFTWAEIEPSYKRQPDEARVMCEAKDFKLGSGLTIPMLTLEGESAGLSFAGEQTEFSPEQKGMLQLIGIYSFAQALNLSAEPKPVQLTPRERDVLHWLAEGKSEWEIGQILHVSEHMIDKVGRNIRAKLGATNKTHAVAYAFRHKLIQ